MNLDRLDEFLIDLHSQYPDLHYGGCCVLAAHLAYHLSNIVDPEIVVRGYGIACIEAARNNINGGSPVIDGEGYLWNDEGIDFSHVLVEFNYEGKRLIVDGDGVRGAEEYWSQHWRKYDGFLYLDEADALASNPRNWNATFDRADIPAIKDEIDSFFYDEVRAA